jgi:hypothetical protein
MKAAISATQDVREQNVSGCSSELHIGLLLYGVFRADALKPSFGLQDPTSRPRKAGRFDTSIHHKSSIKLCKQALGFFGGRRPAISLCTATDPLPSASVSGSRLLAETLAKSDAAVLLKRPRGLRASRMNIEALGTAVPETWRSSQPLPRFSNYIS